MHRPDGGPVRLLAVIDSATLSGPGRQLVALLAALRADGLAAELLTFQRTGRPTSALVAHAEQAGIPVTILPERGPLDRTLVAAMRRHLRHVRPDIIQTHSYKATALAWWLRRTGERFGWVGCFHGATTENLKVRAYHRLDQWLLRSADAPVIVAESQRRGLGSAARRAQMIRNAVLPPPPTEGAAPPWSQQDAPVFATVGRLSPEKGVDILLQAAAALQHRHPMEAWSVVIVGDGQERTPLEALASQLGISRRVRFVGAVADPWPTYRHADVVVIPSRSEGLPNVLLEAMAADLPVIATAVGAIPDLVGGGHAATLVPTEDVQRLAAAMEHVLLEGDHPEAAADRKRIRQEYALPGRVAAHLAVYRGVLSGTGRLPA